MLTTINISLPKDMYKDAKRALATKRYSSVSELIRDALRKTLYGETTQNGFIRGFEDEVLASASEPGKNDIKLRTDKEVGDYFRHLKVPKRYIKSS
jgi:Arc/MetJ-type ribon-helix-helix transcriptional regulator